MKKLLLILVFIFTSFNIHATGCNGLPCDGDAATSAVDPMNPEDVANAAPLKIDQTCPPEATPVGLNSNTNPGVNDSSSDGSDKGTEG